MKSGETRRREPNKYPTQPMVEERYSADSDELQLLDECNSEWVDAWKNAAKQLIELSMHIFARSGQQKMLARTKSARECQIMLYHTQY